MLCARCRIDVRGWPRVVYSDNGTHFRGEFDNELAKQDIRHVWAPAYHPSSVGLAERHVQLVLSLLRKELQSEEDAIFKWDEYIPKITHLANTRVIRAHGFTPSELLLGFNPRRHHDMEEIEATLRQEALASQPGEVIDEGISVEEANYEAHLAKMDEMRDMATKLRLSEQDRVAERSYKEAKKEYKGGDLVLQRRLAQDNQKSHKLEPRWEGPYQVGKISENSKSIMLRDIHSGKDKGKYHTNDVKPFIIRKENIPEGEEWNSVAARNDRVRVNTRNWLALRDKARQDMAVEFHKIGRPVTTDDLDQALIDREANPFRSVPTGYHSGMPDETDWRYWQLRAVTLADLFEE